MIANMFQDYNHLNHIHCNNATGVELIINRLIIIVVVVVDDSYPYVRNFTSRADLESVFCLPCCSRKPSDCLLKKDPNNPWDHHDDQDNP